ncbi:hypothetical protein BD289DRAFT_449739 [Coniella lustricola]|uniref:Association with the SNF1 complex (ASC) domain-containing protein n=1 Tax=Coniella lustricola TaxID=2025994 RepID=A0A2T3AL74_9PEZI|nr:hypothetical protein BD289DRAFT_449739 [Coniella lustricola]
MGNQPTKESGGSMPTSRSGSTSRNHHLHHASPRHQSSSSSTPSPQTPYRSSVSSSRAPIGVHNHRAAAPAQASLAQAHGSTDIKNSQALPITSLAASPVGSTKSTLGAAEHKQSAPLPVPSKERAPAAPSDATGAVPAAVPPQRTLPVDVPNNTAAAPGANVTIPLGQTSPLSPFDSSDAGIHSHGSLSNMSFLQRPPRLPLPIEEEVHTPGSPIVAPTENSEPVDAVDLDSDGNIARKSSNLSNTTIDEDDAEELRVDKTRPTVPTRLEWRRGGDRVYVTGTIFHWNRKQRLHPVEGQPGVFATTINILPGTHHIRFLVDNNMQTSPDLPTTVDFGNNLVNYIEVSPDDVPTGAHDASAGAPTLVETPADDRAKTLEESAEPQGPRDKQLPPREAFSQVYPQYLLDYDEPEDSPVGQAAAAAIEKLDTPPSLPGFLAKPILNAATLMKDDNSVLNMPNHTTLNHLATSSIKNGTLAVSATTRYRDKYVTTIMYKPVPNHA